MVSIKYNQNMCIEQVHRPFAMRNLTKQETSKDGMAGLQSKFPNFDTKVNQMWTTDRRTLSIHKRELQPGQKSVILYSTYICMHVYDMHFHFVITDSSSTSASTGDNYIDQNHQYPEKTITNQKGNLFEKCII